MLTHRPVTEAHSAGLPLPQEQEVTGGLDKGNTGSDFVPAAHFTRVPGLYREKGHNRGLGLNNAAICWFIQF